MSVPELIHCLTSMESTPSCTNFTVIISNHLLLLQHRKNPPDVPSSMNLHINSLRAALSAAHHIFSVNQTPPGRRHSEIYA